VRSRPSLIRVAETGAREHFTDFGPFVAAIDDTGGVAFWAREASGEGAIIVARADGVHRVAHTGEALAELTSHPAVHRDGSWCAYAKLATGEHTLVGGGRSREWDARDEMAAVGPLGPTMSRAGVIAFRGALRSGAAAVLVRSGSDIERIAIADGAPFTSFHGLPVVDAAGTVVFRADTERGAGIYAHRANGSTIAIADDRSGFRALSLFPSVNGAGKVVFAGSHDSGAAGVFIGDVNEAGPPRLVLASAGAFSSIRGALVADDERVVFFATPAGGSLGIYELGGGCLLALGDRRFGSEVVDFALNSVSISAAGLLAIRVALADGRQVIARTDGSD
jgi:hypothetical protein